MQTNFLVVGSGIAGLNFALHAASKGHVTVITKKRIAETATNKAQGGIAAVIAKEDEFQAHIEDTMKAGAYHNNKKAVKFMIENGPAAITRLIELGVQFEKEQGVLGKPGKLKLAREGGHRLRRIAYKGDYTGQEIESILVKRVKEHPNIDVIENAFAVDLLRKGRKILGAKIIKNNKIDVIFADAIILATGGIGQIYQFTTNPEIATGDGMAMAIRAGAKMKDLEFVQFHPTAFAAPKKKNSYGNSEPKFLLSEALRGEGAILINSKGERFMSRYSAAKELAARDIVARSIYQELKKGPVYISFQRISQKKRDELKKRFPQITQTLKKYKFDLKKDPIPIVPVAHYMCGGIKTDLFGRTNLKNLYAFGECAYTGVHGANRLASNSLLEAVVFSNQVVKDVKPKHELKVINLQHERITNDKELLKKVSEIKKASREIMWQYCGIVRTKKDLKEGIIQIKKLTEELTTIQKSFGNEINRESIEVANVLQVSLEVMKSALKRKKSLGCHFVTKN